MSNDKYINDNNSYSYNELIDFTDFSYFDIEEGDYSNKGITIGTLMKNNNNNNPLTEDKAYNKEYLSANFSNYSDYEILKVQNNEDKGFYGVALRDPATNNIIVSIRGSSELIDWDHNILETTDKYLTSQGQYNTRKLY